MIKGISITNFKGVGDPGIHLDLKPITMLFGTNSAGKSTIFHALVYAYEVFVNRNLNPDRTTIGGDAVDLGGFETFIHRHELHRGVMLEFDLDMSNETLDAKGSASELLVGGAQEADVSNIGADVWTAKVRLQIHWDPQKQEPYVSEYAVTLNDEPVGRITYDPTSSLRQLEDLNLYHSLFAWPGEIEPGDEESVGTVDFLYPAVRSACEQSFYIYGLPVTADEHAKVSKRMDTHVFPGERPDSDERLRSSGGDAPSGNPTPNFLIQQNADRTLAVRHVGFYAPSGHRRPEGWEERMAQLAERWLSGEEFNTRPSIQMLGDGDAMPTWDEPLPLDLLPEAPDEDSKRSSEDVRRYHEALIELLTRLLILPGKFLGRELKSGRHVGPLREIPPRNHQAQRTVDNSRWASGLAAWDFLHNADDETIRRVSDWLERADRLGTGYSVHVKRFRELDSDGLVIRALLGDSHLDSIELIRESLEELPEQKRVVLRDENSLIDVKPWDIAIGITQLIPVVVAALDEDHVGISMIEQPELHNHPAVEVGLGDLFINTLKENQEHCRYLLETHGEHMILRMLRRIGQTTDGELPEGHRGLKPEDFAVYHVNRTPNGVEVSHLRIDETGEFIDEWPQGFFTERGEELFG